jgi:hypothetical protein
MKQPREVKKGLDNQAVEAMSCVSPEYYRPQQFHESIAIQTRQIEALSGRKWVE